MKSIYRAREMVREKVSVLQGENGEDGLAVLKAQKMLHTVNGVVQNVKNWNGPDKNADTSHETLLQKEMEFHIAAKENNVEKMTSLKGQKININSRNNLNRTALHFAVAKNNLNAVTFLLNHKARVDIVDKHGLTVLHLAAWSADLNIFQKLINAGASQKSATEDGMNVLHFAAQHNKLSIVDYILTELQLKDLNVGDKKGKKPFHLAAENGHLNMVSKLVDLNLFSPDKDKDGNTALHLAAKKGHSDLIGTLLNLFEDIDQPNEIGATPFYLAIEGKHIECGDLLLQAGSNINAATHDGRGALHIAAENGLKNMIHFLIDNNFDIKPNPNDKNPPLHLAIRRNFIPIVDVPSNDVEDNEDEIDTDKDLPSDLDQIPNYMTKENVPPESGHDLNDDDTGRKISSSTKAKPNYMEIVDVLMERGCDLNAVDTRQQTALHLVAEFNNIDLVQKLLKSGHCDLTIADKQGKTALKVAARSNNTLIVDMIIKAERYYTWKKECQDDPDNQKEFQDSLIDFKQDHSLQTRRLREALWKLAYNELRSHGWKKLAQVWLFTEAQLKAIEEEWTGQASYKEHGHRMLLIWLHGALLKDEYPNKIVYEELTKLGKRRIAVNWIQML
uniref:Ankyrin repeat and death domain containing 1B n=1 Tax=Leptobrachium leishanense TaxID=445787 RepID=A0A8C5QBD1_9ANUR